MTTQNSYSIDFTPKKYVPRINTGGNYCGHYPDSPRLNLAVPYPIKLPKVLINFNERFKGFFARPLLFPSLNYANGSKKQMSSARREACISLMSSISLHTELSSMRVGFPTNTGFTHLTVNVLAKHAGISLSRAKRALKDLNRGGFLSLHRRYDINEENGKYKGLASVKKVNSDVFELLGLKKMLAGARAAAYSRLKRQEGKDRKKITVADRMRTKLYLNGVNQTNKPGNKKLFNEFPKKQKKSTRQAELIRFLQNSPNATSEEIKVFNKRLKEKYPTPDSK